LYFGEDHRGNWAGVIKVADPQGSDFLFFSYLMSMGTVGDRYFASTDNVDVLTGFSDAVRKHLGPRIEHMIRIEIVNGSDLHLAADGDERILYRRGLLFEPADGVSPISTNYGQRRGFFQCRRESPRSCHQPFEEAFALLTAQFRSGKKNHRIWAPESARGFMES